MAASDYTDFRIFNREFYGGMNEILQQNTNAFNAASNGSIRLVEAEMLGHFEEEAFFQSLGAGLVTRRDGVDLTDATPLGLTSDTFKRPKLLRKVGPIENTLDSLKKIGSNPRRFSFLLGQQVAKAKQVDWLNTLLTAGVTCFGKTTTGGPSGVGTFIDHASAGETLRIAYMIEAMAAMGDAMNLVAWVGTSKAYYDLMGEQATNITDRLAGATIYEGSVGTMGLPFIVVDSPDLVNTDGITSGTDSYYTMGLTASALFAADSETSDMLSDIPLGKQNLTVIVQGEHAFNVGVKGYSYTDSTENPTDAAFATPGNWTLQVSDQKDSGGILIEHA